jgi:hypothetical protein
MVNVIVSSAGVQGPPGNTILSGTGAPGSGVGVDGDFYADITDYPTSLTLYGPKAGSWPGSGIVLSSSSGGVTSVNEETGAVTITAAGLGALTSSNAASTVVAANTFGQSSAVGTDTTYARENHSHGTPALPTATTSAPGIVQLDGTAGDIQPLGAQAAGSIGKSADAGHVHPATGIVTGVTAADTSVVVGGTGGAPTLRTATLDVIATQHPAAAAWSNNGQRITSGANGSSPTDFALVQQLPAAATTGAAGTIQLAGDLGGTAAAPSVLKVDGVAVSGSATAGTVFGANSPTSAAWQGAKHVGPWIFNVAAYAAKGDGRLVTDGAMSSGSPILTSASNEFANVVPGTLVIVKGAGPTGVTTLVTTAASKQSNGQITLNAVNASGGNLTGATVMWATDDTAALQAAINAAVAYAAAHGGAATVFLPAATGAFYGVGGALQTGGSTLGNAQLTLPIIATTVNKVCLTIEGSSNGSGLQHWQQTVPQFSGSTIVSFGVYASIGAQNTSINNNGNGCVLGGPSQPGGYGVAPGVFSNMLVTVRDLSILTTHSSYGLTYSALDLSGVAEANLVDFAYGTTGNVPGGDFEYPASFATGESIGVLMPANGNNDNNRCQNVSCHGGYTWAFYATEHLVCDRMCLLYCWSAFCPVGNYFGGVGSTHAMYVSQLSIEGCSVEIYVVGAGSGGIGPFVNVTQLDTESGAPTLTDNDSGTALAAMLGTVRLTGLFTPSAVTTTHPTGLKVINGQSAYPVTAVAANYPVLITDGTILVDATAGPVTVTLISAAWTPNSYTVEKIDSSGNAVTVSTILSQTILVGATSATSTTLPTQGSKVTAIPARVSGTWGWYAV